MAGNSPAHEPINRAHIQPDEEILVCDSSQALHHQTVSDNSNDDKALISLILSFLILIWRRGGRYESRTSYTPIQLQIWREIVFIEPI